MLVLALCGDGRDSSSRLSCTGDLVVCRTSDVSRRGASGIVVSGFFVFFFFFVEGVTVVCRKEDEEGLVRRATSTSVGIERNLERDE